MSDIEAAYAELQTALAKARTIAGRLLFNPGLTVLCPCGRPTTVTHRSAGGPFRDEGPLDGSHGRADIERRCEPCNVQIDITIHA